MVSFALASGIALGREASERLVIGQFARHAYDREWTERIMNGGERRCEK